MTPSSRPGSASSRISLMSAVSTKNFMAVSFRQSDAAVRAAMAWLSFSRRPRPRSRAMTQTIRCGRTKRRARAGADAGRARLHLCGAGGHDGRARLDRAGAARAARGGRRRLGRRRRRGRSEEAAADRPCLRLPAADRRHAPLHRLGRRLHAVAAGHGGAHGAARAGGVRSGAADRGAAAHRRTSRTG